MTKLKRQQQSAKCYAFSHSLTPRAVHTTKTHPPSSCALRLTTSTTTTTTTTTTTIANTVTKTKHNQWYKRGMKPLLCITPQRPRITNCWNMSAAANSASSSSSFDENDINSSSPSSSEKDAEEQQGMGVIRELPLIALPMTAGNDVLFPGCHQVLKLDGETMARVSQILESPLSDETPEFVYIALNAWGDAGNVGTVAVVEDMMESEKTITCCGVGRVYIHEINSELSRARVEMFCDKMKTEESEQENIEKLEDELVSTMKNIVTLTIKISDDEDHTRQHALEATLKRVESFYTNKNNNNELNDDDDDEIPPTHWIMQLTPQLRRELLSFIVIDMLSVSFMDRRSILQETDTAQRLDAALQGLQPFVKELAAKGAIVGALGKGNSSDSSSTSSSSSPPSST